MAKMHRDSVLVTTEVHYGPIITVNGMPEPLFRETTQCVQQWSGGLSRAIEDMDPFQGNGTWTTRSLAETGAVLSRTDIHRPYFGRM